MANATLNKVQKAAVESFGKPILIFAGAGSGKTRVLTHKIAHLIKEDLVKPENILALTFTNKAADEMRVRVNKIIKNKSALVTMGTFHSVCAKILRSEIEILGYTPEFSIFDTQDQLSLIKVLLEPKDFPKNYMTPKDLRFRISNFKNKMVSPEEAKKKANIILEKQYAELYDEYQKALKKNNAVDFDDLLLLPLQIFDKEPKVLKKYQDSWKYILVDEYQDTNKPQFMLVKRLAESHQQICVVGDDDQLSLIHI